MIVRFGNQADLPYYGACITDPIRVAISLVWIYREWAVVTGVTEAVRVAVGLVRVRQRTVVAGIADAIRSQQTDRRSPHRILGAHVVAVRLV